MVNIDFHNLSPVMGCPLKSPQGTVPVTLTCHIYIYDHIYIEVALGQDCQMYNKLAAPCITNWQHHGSGLPYNISSSERVNSPNLGNYSPYELTFGRKPKLLLNTETNPDVKVSRNFKEYYDLLNKRIKYLQDILFNFKS